MGQFKLDWRFYWNQLRRRLWLVIAVIVISLAAGAFQVAKTRPLYQASTQLLVQEPTESKLNPFRDPLAVSGGVYMRTQLRLLKSRSLALEVVKTLGLDQHPEFAPPAPQTESAVQLLKQWGRIGLTWGQTQAGHLLVRLQNRPPEEIAPERGVSKSAAPTRHAPGTPHAPATQDAPESASDRMAGAEAESASMPRMDPAAAQSAARSRAARLLLSRLKVNPVPLASMVSVSFQSHDPQLAVEVANTHARLYVEQARLTRFGVVQEAMDWLQGRVDDMRDKVESSQLKLQQYKKEHGIYSLDDRLPGVMQEMAALSTALTQARTERIEIETLYEQMQQAALRGAALEWMPSVVGNEFIQELKRHLAALQRDWNRLAKKYGSGHPQVTQLRGDIAAQETQIQEEVQKILASTRTQLGVLQAREAALSEQLERLEQEAHALNEKAIHYETLKREAQSDQRLSDLLLTRLKETSLSPSASSGDRFRIVDVADIPTAAINIRPSKTLTRAGLIGLVLGLGLAFGLGYLDNTLKDPEEAEQYLGFPVIGLISRSVPKRQLLKSEPGQETGLVALDDPRSPTAEAYKMLRTNLLFSYTDPPRKVFLITSSHPNEGKTTIAGNLAVVMAQMERRVLLVEADLRNPSLWRTFDVEGRPGLSELLLTEKALCQV